MDMGSILDFYIYQSLNTHKSLMTLQARTKQRKRQTIKQAPIGLHTISSGFGHFSPFQISTKHGSFKNAF